MTSVRKEILQSWVYREPSMRDLAALLGLSAPVGMRDIINRMRTVETLHVSSDVVTPGGFPLGGHIDYMLRSDGTYSFSGHMRATGFPSYGYGLQTWVVADGRAVIAAQKSGHVFGTIDPGGRQQNWAEAGVNLGIVMQWRLLRQNRSVGYRLDAEIGGSLGSVRHVLAFAIKGLLFGAVLGPAGWVVLIGNDLIDMDAKLGSPDTLAGILVGVGTFYIVGPFGLVPALVAGASTVALADVRHRPMNQAERDLADRVFRGTINYDKVILTNLTHDGGRNYAIPSVGKAILVNLGDSFNKPTTYCNDLYPKSGSNFIHELVHVWQIQHSSLLNVIRGMDSNYDYFDKDRGRIGDTAWQGRSFDTFNNEQQAHIVDDWYGAHVKSNCSINAHGLSVTDPVDAQGLPVTDLDGVAALNDPAYRFIRDNIRARSP